MEAIWAPPGEQGLTRIARPLGARTALLAAAAAAATIALLPMPVAAAPAAPAAAPAPGSADARLKALYDAEYQWRLKEQERGPGRGAQGGDP